MTAISITPSDLDIVTGGAGFIGSHLVDRLLADGRHVRVLDSFVSGGPHNLAHQQDNPRLQLVQADIRERDIVAAEKELVKDATNVEKELEKDVGGLFKKKR